MGKYRPVTDNEPPIGKEVMVEDPSWGTVMASRCNDGHWITKMGWVSVLTKYNRYADVPLPGDPEPLKWKPITATEPPEGKDVLLYHPDDDRAKRYVAWGHRFDGDWQTVPTGGWASPGWFTMYAELELP